MRFCNISVCYWLCSTAFVIEDCNIISTIEILNWKNVNSVIFSFSIAHEHLVTLSSYLILMISILDWLLWLWWFWLHVEGDLKLISTYAHIGLDNSQACLENSCPFVCVHHEKVSMKKLNAGFLCGLTVTLSLIT